MRHPAGRRPRGPALLAFVDERRRAGGGSDDARRLDIHVLAGLRRRRAARAWASSPTRACASAARRARSRARSGTASPTAAGLHRRVLRQHGRRWARTRWRHVAFIEQRKPLDAGDATPGWPRSRRAAGWPSESGLQTYQDGDGHALADDLRRLQALHRRRLPGGLPDRRAVPHRVRHRRRPGGRLQRLRLLRARLPVRGASTSARTTAASGSARSATTGCSDDMEPACAQACPTDSIQFGELDELRERAEQRLAHAAGGRARGGARCTAPTRATASAASAPSSCCSTSPRSTGCRPTRSTRRATSAASGRRRSPRPRRSAARSPAPCSGGAREARARRDALSDGRSAVRRPVIKPPVWTHEIPFYFFAGGLAGASAGFALLSDLRGDEAAGAARLGAALAGAAVSPALLISDLGRPERFLNMLRVFKVTSPMSVGSWILSAFGAATAAGALHALGGGRLGAAGRSGPGAARRCSGCRSPPTPARSRQHRGAGVARRAPRAAVRVRGQRGDERRRGGGRARPARGDARRRGGWPSAGRWPSRA